MVRSSHTALLFAAALAWPACPPAGAQTAESAAPAPVDALWIEREQTLVYFGQTTYYTCDGLRDKVRFILLQAGARDDLRVTTTCVDWTGGGVERMPSVRIKAAFPAEATPELLAKLAAEAPKRELVARVTGTETDPAPFPAVWRRVEFEGRGRGRIEDGDCELLEDVLERVLVPAGVRVAPESRIACVPGQVSLGSVRVVIDTLQRAPEPDAAQAPQAPGA